MIEVRKTEIFGRWLDDLHKMCGREMVILLAGGDKSTQVRDIETALHLARNL